MSEMIERVARALAQRQFERTVAFGIQAKRPLPWTSFEDEARTAIEAMREPTSQMVNAAARGYRLVTPGKRLTRAERNAFEARQTIKSLIDGYTSMVGSALERPAATPASVGEGVQPSGC